MEGRKHTTQLYVAIWLTVAIVVGSLLGFAEFQRNALSDPDQAWERTGMLLPPLTYEAPTSQLELRRGHRAILVFARTLHNRYVFHDLVDQSDLTRLADLIVVTPDGSRPLIEHGIRRFVTDHDGSLARHVGLRRPIDGGPPVGYVLVDSQAFVRFRTLDPGFGQRAWEIKLLLSGIP